MTDIVWFGTQLQDGYVFNSANHKVPLASPTKQEDIKQATTAWELYQHIHEDCWVVVHIKSAIDDAKQMEGTRLTLVSKISWWVCGAYEISRKHRMLSNNCCLLGTSTGSAGSS